mgnify:CR=1 FL=1
MAASLADGKTTIYNAACEPYLQQLCKMLNSMGANIKGIGSNYLKIEGVSSLSGTTHKILPDINEKGSFIQLAAMTKSDIGTNNFNSQIALDQITSDIDLAQSIAFAKNDTITIVFSVENDNYKLYTGPDANRSIIDDFPGSNDGMVSFATGRLASIDISSINFNNSNAIY